jgi:MFS family permease
MVTKYTISGVALVGPFESSVSTPAIEPTAAEFGSPVIIATLVFSTYHLGLAFGGPFAALLSESFGRRPVVFISLPIFALFILGADFARNIATLVVLRFFAGFFSAPSFSTYTGSGTRLMAAGKTFRADVDVRRSAIFGYVEHPASWSKTEANKQSPALSPLLRAAVTQTVGWRRTSWLILFSTILLVLLLAPFYWMTYKPTLLRQRAEKSG